jgi:hypothetical protein
MATCTVYHNNPSDGPGHMSANNALAEINAARPAWHVALRWDEAQSVYSTALATVTGDDLQAVVERFFANQGYLFTNAD